MVATTAVVASDNGRPRRIREIEVRHDALDDHLLHAFADGAEQCVLVVEEPIELRSRDPSGLDDVVDRQIRSGRATPATSVCFRRHRPIEGPIRQGFRHEPRGFQGAPI
jgi:hypothetical protein